MKLSRLWVPAALLAAVVAIIVIGIESQDPEIDVRKPEKATKITESKAPRPGPVYDEEGRRVLVVGEISLHIPASQNPTSTPATPPENRTVQVTLCWPRDDDTGDCPGIQNVAVIFLKRGREVIPKIADGTAQLKLELRALDGPMETGIPGVWGFRHPSSETVLNYALVEPDATGRHAVARCSNGPRCSAWIDVVPGLTASYDFDNKNLALWPQIDKQVREYVTSFIIEE